MVHGIKTLESEYGWSFVGFTVSVTDLLGLSYSSSLLLCKPWIVLSLIVRLSAQASTMYYQNLPKLIVRKHVKSANETIITLYVCCLQLYAVPTHS